MMGAIALRALTPLWVVVGAVQPPVVAIPTRPDATAPTDYTRLSGLRELPDGRVIVLDGVERRLEVVDLDARHITALSRHGSGPGEFMMPDRLLPLGEGFAGVRDGARPFLLVLSPTAELIATLDPRGPPPRIGRRALPLPSPAASDAAGRFYAALSLLHESPDGRLTARDSFAVVRWGATSPGLDTLVVLPQRLPPTAFVQGGFVISPAGPIEPFRVGVAWAVAGDGTVGVVYPEPYRIELIGPQPGVRRGGSGPIPHTTLRVTAAHRREWRRAQSSPLVQLVYPGGGRAAYARTTRPVPREPVRWPRTLPAVTGEPPRFDNAGRLWVARTTPATAPPIADVFSRGGQLSMQVRLPPATRIVGFGEGVVYLARRTPDDLEILQRHRLPPQLR